MSDNPKIAYSIQEACDVISLGRTNLYKLAADGKIDMRKVGGRALVTAASLHRLIDEAPAYNPAES